MRRFFRATGAQAKGREEQDLVRVNKRKKEK